MEDWKVRLIQEYKELKIKTNKLKTYIDANKIEVNDILYKQHSVMNEYLQILEFRLEEQNIDINEVSRNI
jgi:hypothetical protein